MPRSILDTLRRISFAPVLNRGLLVQQIGQSQETVPNTIALPFLLTA